MPASVRTLVCGLFLALPFSGALAQTDPAAMVGTRLAEAVAASGIGTLIYDSASGDLSSVTLSKVVVTAPDGSTAEVPTLVFSGIVDRPAGGFFAAKVAADGMAAKGETKTAGWATAAFEEVIIPSADEIKTRAPITLFQRATVTGVTLTTPDLTAPFAVASTNVTLTPAPDGTPSAIKLEATGVTIPVSAFGNSVAGVVAGMMQYTEFVGDVVLDGSYDPAAGTAVLNALSMDAPDVGKIALNGKASAFALADILDTDPEISKEARAAARLETLRLRIDNAGLVERVLAMQAEMLGGTPDDVRKQIVDGALPFALSFIKNEAFRTEFRAAVAAFLADPRSLTITFQPAEPMPLGQVARAFARAPQTVPDLLAPKVEANN